jgi:ribosomal protein S18 acetylase RimI-like enzyme
MQNCQRYREVAGLHVENIDQGFLSTLGTPFLSLLYETIDTSERGVLCVVEEAGHVAGFVSGSENIGEIYKALLRRWPRLIVSLMPALFSPRKAWRILEIILLHRKSGSTPDLPRAELLSIAVAAKFRGKGHAQELYRSLANHFSARGVRDFKIVVGDALLAAHHFYLRMGAVNVGHLEIHQEQHSTVYIQHTRIVESSLEKRGRSAL